MSWIKFFFTKVFWLNILIYGILVCIGVYAGLSYLDRETLHGVTIEVPDFSGYHYSELQPIAEEAQMRTEIIDSVFYADEAPGVVISQIPEPGSEVKPNRKIYITINATVPPRVSVPALQDLSLRQALSILQTIGLEAGKLIYEPSICTNCVIRMQVDSLEIEAGTLLAKGDKLDLVLGKGLSDELIPYPVLIGKKLVEIDNILRERGLNLGAVNYQDCENEEDTLNAVIFRQIPDIFDTEVINMGQTINLFLTVNQEIIPEVEVDSTLRLIDKPTDESIED